MLWHWIGLDYLVSLSSCCSRVQISISIIAGNLKRVMYNLSFSAKHALWKESYTVMTHNAIKRAETDTARHLKRMKSLTKWRLTVKCLCFSHKPKKIKIKGGHTQTAPRKGQELCGVLKSPCLPGTRKAESYTQRDNRSVRTMKQATENKVVLSDVQAEPDKSRWHCINHSLEKHWYRRFGPCSTSWPQFSQRSLFRWTSSYLSLTLTDCDLCTEIRQ